MDRSADGWRLRLLSALKTRQISYRKAAELSDMQYTTVQKHLSGDAQYESLWFIRKLCDGCDIPMAAILFGVDNMAGEIHRIPILPSDCVAEWVDGEPLMKSISEWLPYPTLFGTGLRVFGWKVESSDLAPVWPVGSWLYVDPDIKPDDTIKRRLVLAKVKSGYMVRYREILAGEEWLVPQTAIHESCRLFSNRIIGSVIGGVKSIDL